MYVARDDTSAYYSPNECSDISHEDITPECATVMPHVGDMEPVYPLAVEPERNHGAVEIGWPGHLAMLLPDVTTPIPEG
eukprot:472701-Lingulodinium_polyedra.AAC.1